LRKAEPAGRIERRLQTGEGIAAAKFGVNGNAVAEEAPQKEWEQK
jgi:hypothetical protein